MRWRLILWHRWDSTTAGSAAGCHRHCQWCSEVCQAGSGALWACAWSVFRHSQTKHFPVQQLRLALGLVRCFTTWENAYCNEYPVENVDHLVGMLTWVQLAMDLNGLTMSTPFINASSFSCIALGLNCSSSAVYTVFVSSGQRCLNSYVTMSNLVRCLNNKNCRPRASVSASRISRRCKYVMVCVSFQFTLDGARCCRTALLCTVFSNIHAELILACHADNTLSAGTQVSAWQQCMYKGPYCRNLQQISTRTISCG